jgi:hypothetical protein
MALNGASVCVAVALEVLELKGHDSLRAESVSITRQKVPEEGGDGKVASRWPVLGSQ